MKYSVMIYSVMKYSVRSMSVVSVVLRCYGVSGVSGVTVLRCYGVSVNSENVSCLHMNVSLSIDTSTLNILNILKDSSLSHVHRTHVPRKESGSCRPSY